MDVSDDEQASASIRPARNNAASIPIVGDRRRDATASLPSARSGRRNAVISLPYMPDRRRPSSNNIDGAEEDGLGSDVEQRVDQQPEGDKAAADKNDEQPISPHTKPETSGSRWWNWFSGPAPPVQPGDGGDDYRRSAAPSPPPHATPQTSPLSVWHLLRRPSTRTHRRASSQTRTSSTVDDDDDDYDDDKDEEDDTCKDIELSDPRTPLSATALPPRVRAVFERACALSAEGEHHHTALDAFMTLRRGWREVAMPYLPREVRLAYVAADEHKRAEHRAGRGKGAKSMRDVEGSVG